MKKTYRLLLVTGLVIAFSSPAYACGDKAQKLQRKLNLSDKQAEQVSAIFESAHEDRGSCRKIDSKKESRKCMKEKHEKVDTQISALLDEEQKVQFAELKEKRREKMKEKRGKRGRFNHDRE